MKIKVRFQDGGTGGILTTEHSQSSYGIPVFVPDEDTRYYLPEDCYGSGDIKMMGCSPFVPMEIVSEGDLQIIRDAGFRIEL